MEKKESKLNKEVCFLIAKFLQKIFPELAQMFIDECEKKKLFPSSAFFDSPSYNQLNTFVYPSIPSSQLMDLLMLSSKKFNDPSFLRPLIYKEMSAKQEYKPFQPVKRIIGHTFIVYCLSIDKTSQILITGSDDSLVKVWKLPELSLINTYIEHDNVITNIEIHPSNQYFASSSADGIICVFSLITGILKFKKKLPSEINDMCFSQCGKYFSISTKENGLFLWLFDDFILNKPEYRKWSISPKNQEMWWAQFTPLSTVMIFVTATNDIYSYHISSKRSKFIFHSEKEITSLRLNHKLPFKIISTMNHSSYFYVFMNSEKTDALFSQKIKIDLGKDQRIVDANWNSDESLIVVLTRNSGIYAWNSGSLTLTYHIDNSNYLRNCRRLSISPVLPYIVFTSNKNYICSFWDISNGLIQTNSNSSNPENIPLDGFDSSDSEYGEGTNTNEIDATDINDNDDIVNDNNNDDNHNTNNDENTSQLGIISITKNAINTLPLSTCSVYFKIESICWAPNGEYIICSDNLQGFVLFIRKTGEISIQTEHQFLLKERKKYEKAQVLFERQIEIETSDPSGTNINNQNNQQQNQQPLENNNSQSPLRTIDDNENILVDAALNPLIPQPKRWKLHQINLRIKQNEVQSDIINYESKLARIFKK